MACLMLTEKMCKFGVDIEAVYLLKSCRFDFKEMLLPCSSADTGASGGKSGNENCGLRKRRER